MLLQLTCAYSFRQLMWRIFGTFIMGDQWSGKGLRECSCENMEDESGQWGTEQLSKRVQILSLSCLGFIDAIFQLRISVCCL